MGKMHYKEVNKDNAKRVRIVGGTRAEMESSLKARGIDPRGLNLDPTDIENDPKFDLKRALDNDEFEMTEEEIEEMIEENNENE